MKKIKKELSKRKYACETCYHFTNGFQHDGHFISCALGSIGQDKCMRAPSRWLGKNATNIARKDKTYMFQLGFTGWATQTGVAR
jgi:hypothetical protein